MPCACVKPKRYAWLDFFHAQQKKGGGNSDVYLQSQVVQVLSVAYLYVLYVLTRHLGMGEIQIGIRTYK